MLKRCRLSALHLLAVLALMAPAAIADAGNFSDAAAGAPTGKGSTTVATQAPGVLGERTVQGGCILYSDRATFQADNPGLTTYDFENATATPGGLTGCGSPVDASTNDACFSPGDIPVGIAFQATPNGTLGNLLITPGDGTFGSDSRGLVSNTFADQTEALFSPPVFAFGTDLISYLNADTATLSVFDGADAPLTTDTSPSSNASGSFWGVACPGLIGRINMTTSTDQAEGFDNIEFGGSGGPILTLDAANSTDQCLSAPANENGVWEPGEGIYVDAQIRALGGDHSAISCTMSSMSPGVVMISNTSTYPDLTSGSSSGPDMPFLVLLDGVATSCLSTLDFNLDCTSNQGAYNLGFSEDVGQALTPNVPLSIPDNDPAGVGSDLVVAEDVTLTDVNVRVQIDHTWVGDVFVTLTSPNSTTVTLLDQPGVPGSTFGCSDNNMNVTFDDASGFDPENHCTGSDPWYVGDAAPVQALSAFNGESTAGTWTLTVSDNAGGDLGTIIDWELITDPPVSGVCTTCDDAGPPFGGGGGQPIIEIPTTNTLGLVLLALLLGGSAIWMRRRERTDG